MSASASALPALALVGQRGRVERMTEPFQQRHGLEAVPADQLPELKAVLDGRAERARGTLNGSEVLLEAVVDSRGTRRALLTFSYEPDPSAPDGSAVSLEAAMRSSPAIVFLKDLEGRYLHVNQRYSDALGVGDDQVRGRTDRELGAGQTIDGPRLQDGAEAAREPLQLEYSVPAFENRPAFAVLRFAVRDRNGNPVGACGVAAPLAQAHVARAQCAHLMQIERWTRLDHAQIRAEILGEWGVEPTSSTERELASPGERALGATAGERDVELAAAIAERDSARSTGEALERELDEHRRRIAALHEASATAAARAHELLADLTAERARASELEASVAEAQRRLATLEAAREENDPVKWQHEVEQARAEAEQARVEAEQTRGQLQRLHADLAPLRAELELVRADLERAREQADEAQADVERAREQAEHSRADAERAREQAKQSQEDAERARADAERARADAELAGPMLQQVREESEAARAELERAILRIREVEAEAQQWRERALRAEADARESRIRADESDEAISRLKRQVGDARADAAAVSALLAAERDVGESLRSQLATTQEQLDLARRTRDMDAPATVVAASRALRWEPASQRALSTVLAGASDWRTGLKDVTRVMASEGGWDVVTAFAPDQKGRIRCLAMWTVAAELAGFETLTWQRPLATPGTAVGEALYAPQPTWLRDLQAGDEGRLGVAAEHGLRSALLLPIRDGIETIALLELMTREETEPDGDLMTSLEAVALQLGHFAHLLRLGARPHWRLGRL